MAKSDAAESCLTDKVFINVSGNLVSVKVNSSTIQTDIAVLVYEYNSSRKVFTQRNTLNKTFHGRWRLMDTRHVFCNFSGKYELCILLGNEGKASSGNQANACLCFLRDLKTIEGQKFTWTTGKMDTKAWITDGPSVLICDLKDKIFKYMRYGICSLEKCGICTFLCKSKAVTDINGQWTSAYFIKEKKLAPLSFTISIIKRVLGSPHTEIATFDIVVTEAVCQHCCSEGLLHITVEKSSLNVIPQCYSNVVNSIHALYSQLKSSDRVILSTKIGQLILCKDGDVEKVCDLSLPQDVMTYQLCWNSHNYLAVHDKINQSVHFIDMDNFEIIKTVEDVKFIIIGNFAHHTGDAVLCLRHNSWINDTIENFLYFTSHEELIFPLEEGEVPKAVTNEIPMELDDFDISMEPDLFSSPLETNQVAQESASKLKIQHALQRSITCHRDMAVRTKDILQYKNLSVAKAFGLIQSLAKNRWHDTDNSFRVNTASSPPLVNLFSEQCSNVKSRVRDKPIESCAVKILSTFQKIVHTHSYIFVCAHIKNVSDSTVKNLVMHVMKSPKCQRDSLNSIVKYRLFRNPKHQTHFSFLDIRQSSSQITDIQVLESGSDGFISGWAHFVSEFHIRNCTYSASISYNSNTEICVSKPSILHICDINSNLLQSDSINILSPSIEDIVFLNSIHTYCFCHSVSSKTHSVSIIRDKIIDVGFINFGAGNVYICNRKGYIFYVRILLIFSSQTSCDLTVACESEGQHDYLIYALKRDLPPIFTFTNVK